jgi:hypothetical protein
MALTKKLKYFWKETAALNTVKDGKEKRNQINHPELSSITSLAVGCAISDWNISAAHKFTVGLHGKKLNKAPHTNTTTSQLNVVFLQNPLNHLWWRKNQYLKTYLSLGPLHSNANKSELPLL